MIDFEHVYKTYETHNDENVALEDINIHIDEGDRKTSCRERV